MRTTEEDVQRAVNRAYFYLKFRQRTEYEVRRWLSTKSEKFYHWKDGIIDTAIDRLKEENLINDLEFVESFVRTRTLLKPKSEFALRQELASKYGVSKDTLDEYFDNNEVPEEELARDALQRKWSRFSRLDKKERFEKAAQFLMRRGFSFSTAKKVIEEM